MPLPTHEKARHPRWLISIFGHRVIDGESPCDELPARLRRLLYRASISSLNKPAGVPCVHLDTDFRCTIFGRPERPACCAGLQAAPEMCGESRQFALHWLADLEVLTCPG